MFDGDAAQEGVAHISALAQDISRAKARLRDTSLGRQERETCERTVEADENRIDELVLRLFGLSRAGIVL